MKVLVISDLHANWQALEAVLADCQGEYSDVVCCGDLVGYNAEPEKVIDWTRRNCQTVIRGNHDKVVAGLEDPTWFNDVAKAAARWTAARINDEQTNYLERLSQGPLELEHFHLCHGSPRDEDGYVTSAYEAAECFPLLHLPLTFFGHTHLQGGFFLTKGRIGMIPPVRPDRTERVLEMEPDVAYMINPGSVGQPRDGDPRCGYAIYDPAQRTVTLRRVSYSIASAAQLIREAGLPEPLAARLFRGS